MTDSTAPLITVPYHLDERLPDLPLDRTAAVNVDVPLTQTGTWPRIGEIAAAVADAVDVTLAMLGQAPVVVSGDCLVALGVVAGLQRGQQEPSMVFIDAHGDFNTPETTKSGYPGGMSLAMLVGLGDRTVPDALGLRPIAEERVLLVDARDLDPAEAELLATRQGRRASVADVAGAAELPGDGPLYAHVDLDVLGPSQIAGLRFPAPGGPDLEILLAAIRRITGSGRVVAWHVSATWDPSEADGEADRRKLLADVLAAATEGL